MDIIEVETATYVLEETLDDTVEILEVSETVSEVLVVEGSQGLPGPAGPPGAQGPQGIPGPPGSGGDGVFNGILTTDLNVNNHYILAGDNKQIIIGEAPYGVNQMTHTFLWGTDVILGGGYSGVTTITLSENNIAVQADTNNGTVSIDGAVLNLNASWVYTQTSGFSLTPEGAHIGFLASVGTETAGGYIFTGADTFGLFAGACNDENLVGSIRVAPNGVVEINQTKEKDSSKAYKLPAARGSAGQVLTSDGVGNTTWGTPAAVPTFLAPRVKSVPFASNLVLDWSDADTIKVVLSGNATVTMTGATQEQKVMLVVEQSTGGHVLTFGSEINYSQDLPAVILSTGSSKRDRLGFIRSGDTYDFVAINKGF